MHPGHQFLPGRIRPGVGSTVMTKLRIISRLWSSIYDLLLLAKGTPVKTLDEIEKDLDLIEYHCRPYAEEDDPEERR